MHVGDPGLFHSAAKGSLGKPRLARNRRLAHVDQGARAGFVEGRQHVVQPGPFVADGEDGGGHPVQRPRQVMR